MWSTSLVVLLVACLPGVILFRLPFGDRGLRANLPVEERVFWYVVLSFAATSIGGLVLAAGGWYRFERLLLFDAAVCAVPLLLFRGQLRLRPKLRYPRWSAILPIGVLAVTALVSLRTPPAEYVIGGKDPGTYFNEGIQIAQRGTLGIEDRLVASIPADLVPLFAVETDRLETAYGSRFMGFYLVDPTEGRVMGQFPHLYPVWIAVGYGINGLTGARYIVTLLAALGVLSVYFAGAWLVGRPAAAAAAVLLALNVVQVWYSRYPNAEIPLQVLTFTSILAYSRANEGNDRFFNLTAAVLVTLAGFTHLTGFLVIGTLGVAALLSPFAGRRIPLTFLVVTIAGGLVVAAYYALVLTPYIERYLLVIGSFPNLTIWMLGGLCALGVSILLSRSPVAGIVYRWLPWIVVMAVSALAVYAYFFRFPVGRLAPHDAAALRTFTQFYLSPLGLAAALVGLVLVGRQRFWSGLGFILMLVGFSLVFFYKIRIIPEHFWAARRFVAVILPGMCLLIGAAAFPFWSASVNQRLKGRLPRVAIALVGSVLVATLGTGYLRASTRIMDHIEYEGVVPQLEAIDSLLSDGDLVLVEAREVSDLHTLALPLAYVYARQVLVMEQPVSDKEAFGEFMSWAKGRYRRVLFMGGAVTQFLSRSMDVVPVQIERFWVPEFESAYDAYPAEVRLKQYDVAVYELAPRVTPLDGFDLDVGASDELWVQDFYDQEVLGNGTTTFRWSRDRSTVTILGVSSRSRSLTLWLNNGGRPERAGPARVEIELNGRSLGAVTVGGQFEPYPFDVPADLAAELEASDTPAELRIAAATWRPGDVLGVDDPRELGVMVDRITVE